MMELELRGCFRLGWVLQGTLGLALQELPEKALPD
jgi:hypothetical protein